MEKTKRLYIIKLGYLPTVHSRRNSLLHGKKIITRNKLRQPPLSGFGPPMIEYSTFKVAAILHTQFACTYEAKIAQQFIHYQ
jgi:hypothetical protein